MTATVQEEMIPTTTTPPLTDLQDVDHVVAVVVDVTKVREKGITAPVSPSRVTKQPCEEESAIPLYAMTCVELGKQQPPITIERAKSHSSIIDDTIGGTHPDVGKHSNSSACYLANWKFRKMPGKDGDSCRGVARSQGPVRSCLGPSMGGLIGGLLYGVQLVGLTSHVERMEQEDGGVRGSSGHDITI
ncbi:unnamed protein product [Linum trigynum]|uniref:Uncharacterized protein n=1 Tax=Linum trigynum TaxID=586398 RepID=A0AAV2EQ75_9ROSI